MSGRPEQLICTKTLVTATCQAVSAYFKLKYLLLIFPSHSSSHYFRLGILLPFWSVVDKSVFYMSSGYVERRVVHKQDEDDVAKSLAS
jgi:hypothetical protein